MARVRKGASRKSTVKFDLGDSDDSEAASVASVSVAGRRRKTIFQQSDDITSSMPATQSIPLMRSRCPTEASQASDINDDLWAENHDLHDRISDLESRLQEVQADREELAALCHNNMDRQWKQRCSLKRPSTIIPLSNPKDDEKIEELELARNRLLWQKAILSVQLQNVSMKHRISRVKAAGLKEQHQESYEELRRKLAQSEAERSRMAKAFELDRTTLQRALADQALELEKSQKASAHAGSSCWESQIFRGDIKLDTEGNSCSLSDELKMKAAPTGTASSSMTAADSQFRESSPGNRIGDLVRSTSPRRGSSTDTVAEQLAAAAKEAVEGDPRQDLLGHAVALAQIEDQHGEIEELQQYTRSLERQLADVVLDYEELHALRQRVRQLENTAWAGEARASGCEASWLPEMGWVAFERVFCSGSAGRSGPPNFAGAAPFNLGEKDQGEKESSILRLEGTSSASTPHRSARSSWDTT